MNDSIEEVGARNADRIRQAIEAHPGKVADLLVDIIVRLGAKYEWSMEDNFSTTEAIAGLAGEIGLPTAGDQTDDALRYYGAAAQHLGYESDLDALAESTNFDGVDDASHGVKS